MKRGTARYIALTLMAAVAWTSIVPSDVHAMLVPASVAQSQTSKNRSEDVRTIQTALESKVLREKLHSLGLTDQEIQSRLSRLSDGEIHQLASQIRAVHPAGELFIGILVVVVLVLLIIYLFKRI